jgi:hypothetical protein
VPRKSDIVSLIVSKEQLGKKIGRGIVALANDPVDI